MAFHPPRPPSIDHGVASFIWAVVLGFLVWLGLVAVGVSEATAVLCAAASAFVIFLFVRLRGEDQPRRQPSRPPRAR